MALRSGASICHASKIRLILAVALDPCVRALFEKLVEGVVADAQELAIGDQQEPPFSAEGNVSQMERLFEVVGACTVEGIIDWKGERDVRERDDSDRPLDSERSGGDRS